MQDSGLLKSHDDGEQEWKAAARRMIWNGRERCICAGHPPECLHQVVQVCGDITQGEVQRAYDGPEAADDRSRLVMEQSSRQAGGWTNVRTSIINII